MKRMLAASVVAIAFAAGQAGAQELRVGFISTLSGGGALVGAEMKRGWDLGLKAQGWNQDGDQLGGVPTRVLIGDDQRKPDVGLTVVNRWVRSDRVHIVAGNVWSHVLMAVRNPVVNNRTILMSTNAGAAPLAGAACSRYFISTSWNNDQTPEAMGQLMNDDGLTSVYLMAPNYQAGKDMLSGFRRTYQGNVRGQILFALGARDYQAELSQLREANPQALMIFAPGGMGVAFMRQWAASGLSDSIRLYTVFTVDWLTLPAIGEAAIGSFHTNYWSPDSDVPANQEFVRAYVAEHNRMPSHFAAQAYDAPALIAAGVRAVNGEVDDTLALARAMRSVTYNSVRGPYRYNVNGMPIQNFYEREVVAGPNGPTIRTTGIVFTNRPDSYAGQCPQRERLG